MHTLGLKRGKESYQKNNKQKQWNRGESGGSSLESSFIDSERE